MPRKVLPTAEQIKTWSTSQLIIAMNQLVAIDLLGPKKVSVEEFDGATGEQLDALMTKISCELDLRIPSQKIN